MHACKYLRVLEDLGRVPLLAAQVEQVGAHLQVAARQAAVMQGMSTQCFGTY